MAKYQLAGETTKDQKWLNQMQQTVYAPGRHYYVPSKDFVFDDQEEGPDDNESEAPVRGGTNRSD